MKVTIIVGHTGNEYAEVEVKIKDAEYDDGLVVTWQRHRIALQPRGYATYAITGGDVEHDLAMYCREIDVGREPYSHCYGPKVACGLMTPPKLFKFAQDLVKDISCDDLGAIVGKLKKMYAAGKIELNWVYYGQNVECTNWHAVNDGNRGNTLKFLTGPGCARLRAERLIEAAEAQERYAVREKTYLLESASV
jgi:hypothetical protein